MALQRISASAAAADLSAFSTIIDARSPAEFALDHLPGAVNWPTLNDEERHLVGSEYKQVAAFDARKRGAMMASRNIAAHLERYVLDQPRDWKPLVYCWRGGQRSGALALVLEQIGFQVALLDGGYRAFRREVLSDLEKPPALDLHVIAGRTGSGKSRLLQALREAGAQVLDLEQLAEHRGSVLGLTPGTAQPSQKMFESRLWAALQALDTARPVFIESESRKVGNLRVPEALITRMRASDCIRLEMPTSARVGLLLQDYHFFTSDVDSLCARLNALRTLRGHACIDAWQALARRGDFEPMVRELLEVHYDPIYLTSMARNFTRYGQAVELTLSDGGAPSLAEAAAALLARGVPRSSASDSAGTG